MAQSVGFFDGLLDSRVRPRALPCGGSRVRLAAIEVMMKLFCVRHGETLYNLEGRIQGQSDSLLSPLGKRQCRAVAATFTGGEIDAIIASPLSRALDTAQAIADHLRLTVSVDPRLMEIHAGVFQGHTWEEIEQKYPADAARWRTQDPDFRIPAGESRRDVMTRAMAAFEAIRESGCRQAVVVAHGGSLSAAIKALLEIPAARNPFTFSNGSISTLVWESNVKLLTLNVTSHLHHATSGDGEL
jgi:broad specificity phosphatase PhoE